MTKWQLAQMMGATLEFDSNPRTNFRWTVRFGKSSKYFDCDANECTERAAELVFSMIREAVDNTHNTWSHA